MEQESAQATANIITGTVKWFNVKHGYGFITKEGSEEDIFVHQTAIIKNNPRKYLRSVGDGETVEFIIIQGTKGPEAAQVTGPNGSPVQGSKYAPDRRGPGRGRFRRGYNRRGPRPTQQDSQGEDKVDNSEEAEGDTVDRRRPRNFRRRQYRRRPRGPPKDDSQTQDDGQKDDSASAQPPPRRRNYRRRDDKPRNDDGGDAPADGEEGESSSPRQRNYRGGNYRRPYRPRPQQPRGDGDAEDGADQQSRPPRRRRNRQRNRRPRPAQNGEAGGNDTNQDPPPAEDNTQQKD